MSLVKETASCVPCAPDQLTKLLTARPKTIDARTIRLVTFPPFVPARSVIGLFASNDTRAKAGSQRNKYIGASCLSRQRVLGSGHEPQEYVPGALPGGHDLALLAVRSVAF